MLYFYDVIFYIRVLPLFIAIKRVIYLILQAIILSGLSYSAVAKPLKADAHVLILNSYHPQYLWTQQLVEGAIGELTRVVPPENIHVEYMDSRRFSDDDEHLRRTLYLFEHAYQKFKPDLILTSDDAALNFIVDYGQTLFADIPVVFAGVNVLDKQKLADFPHITGIKEGMEIGGNLQLIRQLQPDINKIYILGDSTGLGREMANKALEYREQWLANSDTANIELEVLTDYSMAQFRQQSGKFDQQTAILILAIHQDNSGHYFSYEYDLPLLTKASNAPVYGMWGGGLIINHGAVGGMLNNPLEHGTSAAKMAVSILNGTSVRSVPIQERSLFEPHFNYHQLQRFAIDESSLPATSKVVFKPTTFYQRHAIVVNVTLVIFALLNVIILLLSRNLKQRIANEAYLEIFNQQLETQVQQRTYELEKQKAQSEFLANHDALTGLPSQRLFTERFKLAKSYAERHQSKVVVLFIDLDGFKAVNDTHGHDAGDVLLQHVAKQIGVAIRDMDTACRMGGDEFLVILSELNNIQQAQNCANRILKAVNEPMTYQQISLSVGCSIGGAIYPDDATDLDPLRKTADLRMYAVKQSGKNGIKLG